MEDRLLDKIAEPFNIKLPEFDSMEAQIDSFLPAVESYGYPDFDGEGEEVLYNTPWVLMSDEAGRNAIILWRFMPTGEIQVATDGEMSNSSFSISETDPNRMIVGSTMYNSSILYILGFLDHDFLILKRHGNPDNIPEGGKYLFLCRESIGTRLVWNEALDRLVAQYRNAEMPWLTILVVIGLIVAALVYFA